MLCVKKTQVAIILENLASVLHYAVKNINDYYKIENRNFNRN